jgi:hypothetical protein
MINYDPNSNQLEIVFNNSDGYPEMGVGDPSQSMAFYALTEQNIMLFSDPNVRWGSAYMAPLMSCQTAFNLAGTTLGMGSLLTSSTPLGWTLGLTGIASGWASQYICK